LVFTPDAKAELVSLEVSDCVKCHRMHRHRYQVVVENTRQQFPVLIATESILPGEKMLFRNVPCVMRTGPILNWRIAWAATPIPMNHLH